MNNLLRKLKGYQKAPRARFLLLKEGKLTLEELSVYELGVAITIWDRNKEDYGTFQATNQELADILGWGSDTSSMRHKKSLIRKGFFVEVDDNRIKPIDFEEWQRGSSQTANKQEGTAEKQSPPANVEDHNAKMQENPPQTSDYSLVSSKVDLSSSNEIPNESLSDEELESILTNINHQKSLHEINEFKSFNV